MSDYLKKLFTINDKIVTYRYVVSLYKARFRRDGYNIEDASKSFDIMRQKFLDKQLAAERAKQTAGYPLLNNFISDWLKVKKQTVKAVERPFCNHIAYCVERHSELEFAA